MRMAKGQLFMDVEEEVSPLRGEDLDKAMKELEAAETEAGYTFPTFSEAVLYPLLGKGDARFVLGVAEEYEHILKAIGPQAARDLLKTKPRLAQRLGVPEAITKCLEDATEGDQDRGPAEYRINVDQAYDLHTALDHNASRHEQDWTLRGIYEGLCEMLDREPKPPAKPKQKAKASG